MSDRHALCLGVLAMFTSVAIAQQAPPAAFVQKVSLNIPAQPVADAIRQLGQQSGLTIVIESQLGRDVKAPALIGSYSTVEALRRILPKQLHTEYLDPKTVAVMASAPTAANLPPPLRMASVAATGIPASTNDGPSNSEQPTGSGDLHSTSDAVDMSKSVATVVVTGTHIRGGEAAGSKVIVIDRDQIDSSGYGRIQDVLGTLTQSFNGSNEASVSLAGGVSNANRGSEVQLRGLGAGSTLTLVNGRRQALGSDSGEFTDISSIPISAIERVEVLPEGASALYGSDAIGGVVNIILRKSFEGFETRVRGGTADGNANSAQFAQLWGHAWSSGNVLLGYQYDYRGALPCSARTYCAANSDFRPFGGDDFRGIGGNPGTVFDPDTFEPIAAIPRGQDGTNLTAAQLIPGAVNYSDGVTYTDILPEQRMHSAFFSASFTVADNWELSADGRYSTREIHSIQPQYNTGPFNVPASNAFNRLGSDVLVGYDFTRDIGPIVDTGRTNTLSTSAALTRSLPRDWRIQISGGYSKETNHYLENNLVDGDAVNSALTSSDPATALNIFGDGSHVSPAMRAAIADSAFSFLGYDEKWTTTSAGVIADGPLLDLSAGALRLAVGSDYRREHLVSGYLDGSGESDVSRGVSAVFVELAVPIIGPRQAGSKAASLELSLAGRYEHYTDFGSTSNPKVGLGWQPWDLIKLRGTWGTSFRAPPFWQSNSRQEYQLLNIPDPKSPTGNSTILGLFGSSPNMRPETAHVWTAGLDLTPPVPNLSLALTFYNIDYKQKIQYPGYYRFLTQEQQFASLITRNPTQAQIDAICNSPYFDGGNCNQPIAAIDDSRTRNLSKLTTGGFDADLRYAILTDHGQWRAGLRGTYTFHYDNQLTATAPTFDVLNTVGNPLKLRLNGNLSWSLAGWTILTTVNYAGAYEDPGSIPTRRVDSWTTVDLNLGFRTASGDAWLADTELNLGVVNLFNQKPPFVNQYGGFNGGALGYDNSNATLIGRQISLQVVKAWGR
jgi:outer membrane receptor protein involved in Fe transport